MTPQPLDPDPDNMERFISVREYEQRHAQLENRVVKLETILASLATREDLLTLKESFKRFEDTVDRFESSVNAAATKADIEWLKKAFWAGVGALVTIGTALIIHILQNP